MTTTDSDVRWWASELLRRERRKKTIAQTPYKNDLLMGLLTKKCAFVGIYANVIFCLVACECFFLLLADSLSFKCPVRESGGVGMRR